MLISQPICGLTIHSIACCKAETQCYMLSYSKCICDEYYIVYSKHQWRALMTSLNVKVRHHVHHTNAYALMTYGFLYVSCSSRMQICHVQAWELAPAQPATDQYLGWMKMLPQEVNVVVPINELGNTCTNTTWIDQPQVKNTWCGHTLQYIGVSDLRAFSRRPRTPTQKKFSVAHVLTIHRLQRRKRGSATLRSWRQLM